MQDESSIASNEASRPRWSRWHSAHAGTSSLSSLLWWAGPAWHAVQFWLPACEPVQGEGAQREPLIGANETWHASHCRVPHGVRFRERSFGGEPAGFDRPRARRRACGRRSPRRRASRRPPGLRAGRAGLAHARKPIRGSVISELDSRPASLAGFFHRCTRISREEKRGGCGADREISSIGVQRYLRARTAWTIMSSVNATDRAT